MFYPSIKKYYDSIFPLNQTQVEFVKRRFNKSDKLIEIGCANGKLTHALNKFDILGVDIEQDFIDEAKNRYEDMTFKQLNMLDIDTLGKFDGIVCFGNTLVHLSKENIEKFIKKSSNQLNSKGRILIQILNYQHILDKKITELPLIDNDFLSFKRSYRFKETLKFDTELTIKKTNQTVNNTIDLYPLTLSELTSILEVSGFTSIKTYSDFKESEFNTNSLRLIITANK
ncbi:class I SAM-dependent methyltransferase [Mycoplasmatota bacterium WC44]